MQFAVAETFFADRVNLDTLAESETLQIFRNFMSGAGVPDESVTLKMDLLTSRQFVGVAREPNTAPQVVERFKPEEIVMDDYLPQEGSEAETRQKMQIRKHACTTAWQ